MLAQIFFAGFRVGEISCPTKYFPEASSINFFNGLNYSFGVLKTAFQYRFHSWQWSKVDLFEGIPREKRHLNFVGIEVKPPLK